MNYMRGAVMKLGQILAHWPDVLPGTFAEVMGRLYAEAPPMHFALLREYVRDELGSDPTECFDEFETTAFAAASLARIIHEHADQTPRTTGTAGLLVPAGTLQILASSTTLQ
ncbi:MAG: putative unusual protein kinase regulating ubiquinone biosynthesis (AarF/ABC1/UbiB family), partial [Planctomycetota bacterium]